MYISITMRKTSQEAYIKLSSEQNSLSHTLHSSFIYRNPNFSVLQDNIYFLKGFLTAFGEKGVYLNIKLSTNAFIFVTKAVVFLVFYRIIKLKAFIFLRFIRRFTTPN